MASTAEGHIAAWGGQLPLSQLHSVPNPPLLASGGCDSFGFCVCMLGHQLRALCFTELASYIDIDKYRYRYTYRLDRDI